MIPLLAGGMCIWTLFWPEVIFRTFSLISSGIYRHHYKHHIMKYVPKILLKSPSPVLLNVLEFNCKNSSFFFHCRLSLIILCFCDNSFTVKCNIVKMIVAMKMNICNMFTDVYFLLSVSRRTFCGGFTSISPIKRMRIHVKQNIVYPIRSLQWILLNRWVTCIYHFIKFCSWKLPIRFLLCCNNIKYLKKYKFLSAHSDERKIEIFRTIWFCSSAFCFCADVMVTNHFEYHTTNMAVPDYAASYSSNALIV